MTATRHLLNLAKGYTVKETTNVVQAHISAQKLLLLNGARLTIFERYDYFIGCKQPLRLVEEGDIDCR